MAFTISSQEQDLQGNKLPKLFSPRSLAFLGPQERSTSYDDELCYYGLGLAIDCCEEDHVIQGFQLIFSDPDEQLYQPFTGNVLFHGQPLDLSGLTTNSAGKQCGQWYWLDRDEDETIIFYETPGREWQIEFDPSLKIKRFITTTLSLMASQQQRAGYSVSKPWPPDGDKP
ncbi:MAG: hypothetical protein N2C12_12115 [Planctomycetales bacterium]